MLFALMLVLSLDLDLAKIVPEAMTAAEAHKHEVLNAGKRCPVVAQQESPKVLSDDDNREIVVFVSNAMPKKALQDLAVAAKNTNTRLVIRGLVNGSIQETAALVKEIGVALDIDPELFERLQVTQVPTFAIRLRPSYAPLASDGKQGYGERASRDEGEEWHTLKGNVCLNYATDKMKERM